MIYRTNNMSTDLVEIQSIQVAFINDRIENSIAVCFPRWVLKYIGFFITLTSICKAIRSMSMTPTHDDD